MSVTFLKTMLEHGAIMFFQDVLSHFDNQVGANAENILIKEVVMHEQTVVPNTQMRKGAVEYRG